MSTQIDEMSEEYPFTQFEYANSITFDNFMHIPMYKLGMDKKLCKQIENKVTCQGDTNPTHTINSSIIFDFRDILASSKDKEDDTLTFHTLEAYRNGAPDFELISVLFSSFVCAFTSSLIKFHENIVELSSDTVDIQLVQDIIGNYMEHPVRLELNRLMDMAFKNKTNDSATIQEMSDSLDDPLITIPHISVALNEFNTIFDAIHPRSDVVSYTIFLVYMHTCRAFDQWFGVKNELTNLKEIPVLLKYLILITSFGESMASYVFGLTEEEAVKTRKERTGDIVISPTCNYHTWVSHYKNDRSQGRFQHLFPHSKKK